tara:strand:+ start:374 stop:1987 length:1614 start_codon:yes stop_codon:yes gene_type:complete
MSDASNKWGGGLNRREFLAASAAAGAMAAGMPSMARAAPKRGGTLRYATRSDGRGLDPHRNFVYYVSHPMALTTMGLVDLGKDMSLQPGVAESWESSADLMKWTFRLRQGAEYHNNRTIDAESVVWNINRIMDPAIGSSFARSAIGDVERAEADGKLLVHFYLKRPSAVMPANLVYYPINLIAPDTPNPDEHPYGCGAFKFKSWKRYAKTELLRFENYFETGEDGKSLPYLDAVDAYPKAEDKVRLTALRAGEVDMIENMSFFDAPDFAENEADKYDIWKSPQVGLAHFNIQAKSGPFAMSGGEDAKLLRQAVVHAIDKEAVHQVVFNGLGEKMNTFYASESPWHLPDVKAGPEYDPEKTRFILRKLNMANMPIAVVSQNAYQYMRNGAEILHAMLLEAGFAATNEVFDNPVLTAKYDKNDYGIDSTASSFRFDPDGHYARWFRSDAPNNLQRTGFANERVDKLVDEAAATTDMNLRKEMYTEVDNIVNDECVFIYHHTVPLTGASVKSLKGYEPQLTGGPNYRGGGVRTAYFDNVV